MHAEENFGMSRVVGYEGNGGKLAPPCHDERDKGLNREALLCMS